MVFIAHAATRVLQVSYSSYTYASCIPESRPHHSTSWPAQKVELIGRVARLQVIASDSPSCSYSLTVFSPSGKLVQIEHALAAVSQGTTSLGIKGTLTVLSCNPRCMNFPLASNGIVIATEKKSSSILIDDSMIEKVAIICPNIGIVYSGMGPDFRILVAKARKSAQAYWKIYNEYPPTKVLTQEIATIMQQATHSGCVSI